MSKGMSEQSAARGVGLASLGQPIGLANPSDSKECIMKLTSAQVERTLTQIEAHAVPSSHPMVPQLNEVFGDHTFFLDSNGLNILEPVADPAAGTQPARIVNLANWSDDSLTKLSPHEPELTDAIIDLGSKH
jgi:hypothetical protein